MRLGIHDLNENEAEWCEKYSKDLLAEAQKKCQTALNKQCSDADVAGLLKFLWSRSPVHESPEEVEEISTEEDDDGF